MGYDSFVIVFVSRLTVKEGPWNRPRHRAEDAHKLGSETSCLSFASDNVTFLSRGGGAVLFLLAFSLSHDIDDTLKLWDLRLLRKGPLASFENLPNNFSMTSCVWSPDGLLPHSHLGVSKSCRTHLLHWH